MLGKLIIHHDAFGCGWSTGGVFEDYPEPMMKKLAEHRPLAKAIKNKEKLTLEHPAVVSLMAWVKKHYPDEFFEPKGELKNLAVVKVFGPYWIRNNDGAEEVFTCYGPVW